jgi:hypothetical protein
MTLATTITPMSAMAMFSLRPMEAMLCLPVEMRSSLPSKELTIQKVSMLSLALPTQIEKETVQVIPATKAQAGWQRRTEEETSRKWRRSKKADFFKR